MFRAPFIEKGVLMSSGFRVRGEDVSRIEGFSDAAFAFAITLLVVSLEVPRTFAELQDIMRGVPAFAVCFAILAWLWTMHYRYFRRFGLEDALTIALNCALLFVVMLYVYPLKFVFTNFMAMLTSLKPHNTGQIERHQLGSLFVFYGVGFVAVFAILGLMYVRAYQLRVALELDELERRLTRMEITRCILLCGVGVLSIICAVVLPGAAAGVAGMVYALIGVVEFIMGHRIGRAKEQAAVRARPA